MTDNHPITPTLKLFREWTEYRGTECEDQFWWRIATQAARWGADQELKACCAYLAKAGLTGDACGLQLTRRPKPPTLKEQALAELHSLVMSLPGGTTFTDATIRRAIEALPDS